VVCGVYFNASPIVLTITHTILTITPINLTDTYNFNESKKRVRPLVGNTPKDELFLLQTLFFYVRKKVKYHLKTIKTAELMPFLSIFTLKY